jgi:hypothetical protein
MSKVFAAAFIIHATVACRKLSKGEGRKEPGSHHSGRLTLEELAAKYEPVVGVTVGWILMYYGVLFRQSETAFQTLFASASAAKKNGGKPLGMDAIKYGNAGGRQMLEATRTAGNIIEQSVPFLVALWMHAALVDVRAAAKLGWMWLAFRSFYPLVFGKLPWLFVSTFPQYLIVGKLVWPLAKLSRQ